MTAADILVETLIDWGVDVIFGLPGDGINGVFEALRTHADKIRFRAGPPRRISGLHGLRSYAKFTGKLGCCLATSGPGGIHLLNGLYDAKMDGQPVLAITGMPFHDLIGTHGQQDVALDKLYMDVAVYNERVMGPTHVREHHRARLPDGTGFPRCRAHHHSQRTFRSRRCAGNCKAPAQCEEPRLDSARAQSIRVPRRATRCTKRQSC